MTADSVPIGIEVAYAPPGELIVLHLRLPQGARVEEAIRASGILERCPEIRLDDVHVGIYGRLVALETPLRDRDRVEIYRPLVVHARDARRRRARERKARAAAADGIQR
jgi:hypothetical protein